MMVHNCHCRLCQQQTGSTSVVNVFIESERVTLLSGALHKNTLTAGSGQAHDIFRCKACGTALWSQYPRLGTLAVGLRAGTLDDPDSVTPDVVIFTESKMPWVPLPEGIPAFEQYYDFAEVLSQDSQDRRTAIGRRLAAGEGS